ncbi:MAG: ABC transporter permease [Nitrospirae bacterium]|nr:ABC transporter permease [Nitrospirota bacterium]
MFNVSGHFQAFRELYGLVTRHRRVTIEMARREVRDRSIGKVFGNFWAFGHPLVMIGIYVFVFTFVFKMKMGGTVDMPLDYTTYILSGLIPWISFQESMAKSTTVIINNANLVKQVVFPVEILPLKGVIVSLLSMFISLTILIVYVLSTHHKLLWTYMLLPFLIFFQMLAMSGVCYMLSSVGVFFRDVRDFIQVFSIVGLYITPVFYQPDQVPAIFRPLLYLNPFSYLTWCYQDALYYGRFEHKWAWLGFFVLSSGIFYFGYRVFRKLKIWFGHVL